MIDNEESGIFFPQNAEYVNTCELVRYIAEVHGKKVKMVKVFNPLFRLLGLRWKLINKVFGNLVYEKSISEYKEDYRVNDLRTSIRKTEE